MDVQCNVGMILNDDADAEVPFFLVDYGVGCPPLEPYFRRYKKLTLDLRPMGKGKTSYIITSDRAIVELSVDVLVRACAKNTKEAVIEELAREATPEFSVIYDVPRDAHESFVRGCQLNSGRWILVVLTHDALLLTVERDGSISRFSTEDRRVFDDVL